MEEYVSIHGEKEARNFLKEGIKLASDTVAPTLGVRGRKILIQKEYTNPEFSDDGVTILKALIHKIMGIQAGIDVVKNASKETNDAVGDGTTTTALLLGALIDQIIVENSEDEEYDIDKKGGNVLKLKKEIQEGLKKVLEFIETNKVEITTEEQVYQIAKVSSNSDDVGKILSEIVKKLGKDASISTVNTSNPESSYEITEGMEFNKGFVSAMFVNDGEGEKAVIKEPYVLVTDHKLRNPDDWKVLMALLQGDGAEIEGINDLVVIADDIADAPLRGLGLNAMSRSRRTLAVRAPGFGNSKEYLRDIATLTGAYFIEADTMKFNEATSKLLGRAESITSTKDTTTIVGGKGAKENIEARITQLKNKMEKEKSEYEKEKIRERISKLSGGVGVVKVGGATELEVEEKKAKIDDAIHAVKSALKEGVVAGGGLALFRASLTLGDTEGEKILRRAIQKPFEQIILNADLNAKGVSVQIYENQNVNYGYNVETEQFGDMFEMGIIDPAKVVKTALQNAVSIALLVMTTAGSVILVREEQKKDKAPMPQM